MTKKSYSYDFIFYVSKQNFTTEHVKSVQNSRFFQFLFFKISQILAFLQVSR